MYLTQTNMFTALTPNAYAVMWSGKLSKPNAIEAKFLKRGQPADAAQRLNMYSQDSSTFLCEIMSLPPSHQKSDYVNRWIFTWRTILPNFITILFETTEP